jgi:hypothetical protein
MDGQIRATRTESRAECALATPSVDPHQKQACDVPASDQENQPD